jgi:hypothetical protein
MVTKIGSTKIRQLASGWALWYMDPTGHCGVGTTHKLKTHFSDD